MAYLLDAPFQSDVPKYSMLKMSLDEAKNQFSYLTFQLVLISLIVSLWTDSLVTG